MLSEIAKLIADVETMGGEPMSEILAPSEIRAIAETIVASNLLASGQAMAAAYPTRFAWMASLPPALHDCFSA
ncbi:hypothetical protein [Sphingomonas yantingensis]|uniref:Uncharacterized protein n=1 Tax=Sphingomonas yantingensis TaxID=1241761 RepID=A0A7W9ART9_9SPHN|nr:hypothetical protein [Sphingomonas yantingensis]MBB5699296.1 hypothetical protein [Sphingomonas yantingensis]